MPFETTVSSNPDYWLFFHNITVGGAGRFIYAWRRMEEDTIYKHVGIDNHWIPTGLVPHWGSIPVLIELESFAPDDSELFTKKIRSLVIEGAFPGEFQGKKVQVYFSFNDGGFNTPLDIISEPRYNDLQVAKFPSPGRVPINQRCKAMGIKIQYDFFYDEFVSMPSIYDSPQRLEIAKMGVLWTPTGRGPVNRTAG